MKRFLLFALAVTMFAACTGNVIVELSGVKPIDEAPETLVVGFEEDDKTRIQLNEAQKTVWTNGDLVSVFYRSDANQKWQYTGDTGERVAELTQVDEGVATETMKRVVVVYPYNDNYYINTDTYNVQATLPATQTYLESSYGLDGNIMISQSEYNNISLKSVCGWLKLQLTGNGEKIKSIKLRGNNGEQVAGELYINSADATAILSSDAGGTDDGDTGGAGGGLIFEDTILKEVTLDCGEGVELGSAATSFYIALPPQTFDSGFTVDITTINGLVMTKSTDKEVTIERNHIQPIATLDAEFVEQIPNNQIWYTSVNGKPITISSSQCGQVAQSNVYNETAGRYEVTFANDVKYIYNEAFDNDTNLLTLTLPSTIISIGTGSDSENNPKLPAFYGNTSLVAFGGPLATPDGLGLVVNGCLYAYASGSENSEFVIPDGVTSIVADVRSENLKSVTIPSSVTSMEDSYWGSSLEAVHINDLEAWCKIVFDRPGTSYEYQSGTNPLYGAHNLYLNGELVTDLVIPESITLIDNHTFRGGSFKSITLHDNITEIGIFAFAHCDNIEEVTLPKSLKMVKYQAFYDCSSLKNVYCQATTVPSVERWNNAHWSTFTMCHSDLKIYIPVSDYRSARGWNEFQSSMVLLPTIPE